MTSLHLETQTLLSSLVTSDMPIELFGAISALSVDVEKTIANMQQATNGKENGSDNSGSKDDTDSEAGSDEDNANKTWHEPWDECVTGHFETVTRGQEQETGPGAVYGYVCADGTLLEPFESFASDEVRQEHINAHGGGTSYEYIGDFVQTYTITYGYTVYIWVPEKGHWVHHEGYRRTWHGPYRRWIEGRIEWIHCDAQWATT
jgi:hypothetical protein